MDIYSNINETLKQQLELNKKLLELSAKKTEILRSNDTPSLMIMSAEEEKLVRAVIEQEKKRGLLLNSLRTKDAAVSDIASVVEKSSQSLAESIRNTAKRLKEVLAELELQNQLNDRIIKLTLEQIEFSKNIIMSDPAPSTYSKSGGGYGSEKQSPGKKFFEDKF